ncbi:Golgi resident protein GCP60 [Tachypleus tridentatus]|uniref:Golgi resident protein GCP60 n=1 Tax=Tachypleus tridentatus TaxID=6853 RepID=UPI003FCFFC35
MAAPTNWASTQAECNFEHIPTNENLEGVASNNRNHSLDEIQRNYKESWGFDLRDLYKLATIFFREKEGKAVHLSYKDRLSLVAYSQQVSHGKYIPEASTPIGYLDVIGRDRRQAWASLGDMSEDDAMEGFVNLLDSACPLFRPYVEAHKRDLEEKERLKREEEERQRREEEERERQKLEEEARQREEHERQKETEQRRLIQEALNRQTYYQFKMYAEQQLPGNPEQQAVLIRQLQEQHYHQYMQQLLQQQLVKNNQNQASNHITSDVNDGSKAHVNMKNGENSSGKSTDDETTDMPPIAAASMWTRKDIKDFKESIRKEGGDGIIRVGHGETVTVRVPTHDDGTCLFWEFATDSYDIGFGVYFEWTKTPGSQVSVHISESEDDDEDEDDADQQNNLTALEKGTNPRDQPPLSIIIPVYRRDCHEEVYAGSHMYAGQGVYQLKFDNSYSLWRSKTLYYRVYYTH